MSTSSESSWSSEDETGQYEFDDLETSEAEGDVEECIARDRLLLEHPEFATALANLRAQRNCQVCFDLDIPVHCDNYKYDYWKEKQLKSHASTYSSLNWRGLNIPLILLESTAKAGCRSCELLRKILRTRPDLRAYLHDGDWHLDYVRIHSRRYPILQSNVIVIDSSSELSPDICFYVEPGCKPTSVRMKPSLNHPWPITRPSPSDVADFVKPRLAYCLSSHEKCFTSRKRHGSTGYLPTRVIAVLDNKGSAIDPVLVLSRHISTTNNDSRRYIALSHCWGKSQPITTTKDNYKKHRKSIPWSTLPQTFQDTILVVRALGVRFLWIDSLCIIQDKDTVYTGGQDTDWSREASKMAEVYRNAWLTIAATSAADGTQGLFMDRPGIQKLQTSDGELSVIIRPIFKSNIWIADGKADTEATSFPLLSRGWALQEHILSNRVLHFTRDELLFECHSNICCECNPNTVRGALEASNHSSSHSKSDLGVMNEYHLNSKDTYYLAHVWYGLVEIYSCRRLAYNSDLLPALSGVANEYQRYTIPHPGKYLAGLWEEDLLRGLLWYTPRTTVPRRSDRNRLWSPPSWSWASMSSEICWSRLDYGEEIAEVRGFSCKLSTADDKGMVTGGQLTLRGKLTRMTMRYTAGDPLPTIYLRGADGLRYRLPKSAFKQSGEESDEESDERGWLNTDGLYLDLPFSPTGEAARGPSKIVLYYLPLLENKFKPGNLGVILLRLPGRSECIKEQDGGNTSPLLYARVGHFRNGFHYGLDQWSEIKDRDVTIV